MQLQLSFSPELPLDSDFHLVVAASSSAAPPAAADFSSRFPTVGVFFTALLCVGAMALVLVLFLIGGVGQEMRHDDGAAAGAAAGVVYLIDG